MADGHTTTPSRQARLVRIALAGLVEPGNRDMGRLVDAYGPEEALARVRSGDLPAGLATTIAMRRADGDPFAVAERRLERADRVGARIVVPDDEEWPRRLDDLRRTSIDGADRRDRDVYPPLCLWVRGPARLADAVERSVAVVGSRASSGYGNHVAGEFGYGLADRAYGVVSGGAFGIDAAAHRGAVNAGGVTVAVLACGIDRIYPAAHASMFERIAETGLLVSEWPPGAAPHRHRFLIRNRVIAALVRGTVVVEASARSGARQTANRSLALGRRTMAVPGPVSSAMSVGTHQLLRLPDVRLVTSTDEIIEEVGVIGDDLAAVPRGPDRPHDRLDPEVSRILDAVPFRGGAGAERIAAEAGVGLRIALQALPFLRTAGFVVEDGGRWRLAPNRALGGHAASDHAAPGHAAPGPAAPDQAFPGHTAPGPAAPRRVAPTRSEPESTS